jgi:diketogulonate reductase-like aldo/keto reductase
MMNSSKGSRLDQSLEKNIKKLDLQKQPERDLWKGIEHVLEQTSDRAGYIKEVHQVNQKRIFSNPKPLFAMVASLMILAVVGWMSFESGKSLLSENLVATLSEQHNVQKQSLLIRFKDQPATTDNWRQQIDELDEAAEAIKGALAEDPNNNALLKILKNVYEQQMTIIERVHEPRWNHI